MNRCILSDTSALVLLWSDESCYPSHQSQVYLGQLSLEAGKQLYNKCNEVWSNYEEVIINRKTGILYLASKTIFNRDISQVVIPGAGLAPLDVDLINRHKLGDMEIFSIDSDNMPLKRKLLNNLNDPNLSRIHCISANLNNISAVNEQLEESGYDKNKSCLIIMEGISYYLSIKNIQDLVTYFKQSASEISFIFEYLVPNIHVREDRRRIPGGIFGIIKEACDLSTITTLNHEDIANSFSCTVKERYTLHDLEKMRTKGNKYFPQHDSGWIEICLF